MYRMREKERRGKGEKGGENDLALFEFAEREEEGEREGRKEEGDWIVSSHDDGSSRKGGELETGASP